MREEIIVSPDETFLVIVHVPIKSPERTRGIRIKQIRYMVKVGERGALDVKRVGGR